MPARRAAGALAFGVLLATPLPEIAASRLNVPALLIAVSDSVILSATIAKRLRPAGPLAAVPLQPGELAPGCHWMLMRFEGAWRHVQICDGPYGA